jgi:hypothetical protein
VADDRAELLARLDQVVAELAALRGLDSIPHARVARAATKVRDLLRAGAGEDAITAALRELEDARRGLFGD